MVSINLIYPFTGRWLVQNSPADRIPSHGTTMFGTSHAIDFVPVDNKGRTAPVSFGSLVRGEAPEAFPGFGRPILAPCDGTVIAVHDVEPDHPAYRGLPSLRYALTQGRRAAAGWIALAGNHVLIESRGVVLALCHLQHGSLGVRSGDRVQTGQRLGRCGNSGNSTEPHLHMQAIDHRDVTRANAVPLTFNGSLPRNGEILEVRSDHHS